YIVSLNACLLFIYRRINFRREFQLKEISLFMRRVIAYTLIVLGLLIMLFPQANEYYENIQTQELLQSIANNGDSESIEFNDAAIDQRLLLEYQNTSKVLEDSINERGTNNDLSDGDVPQRQEKKTSVSGTDRSKAI